MNTLIIGRGEVGNSHYNILKNFYPVWCEDVREDLRIVTDIPNDDDIKVVLVAIRYSDQFFSIVNELKSKYLGAYFNILTTVPVGTTEKFGPRFVHSTTRGLHPNLETGLSTIKKHIGGDKAQWFKNYYESTVIPCETHPLSKTTELLHILNNCHYGVNIMFADEAAKLCRKYGVDYYDYMKYTETNNDGYIALGHKTKVRTICTPPNGKIGGHCVTMSANLIEEKGNLIKLLAGV